MLVAIIGFADASAFELLVYRFPEKCTCIFAGCIGKNRSRCSPFEILKEHELEMEIEANNLWNAGHTQRGAGARLVETNYETALITRRNMSGVIVAI